MNINELEVAIRDFPLAGLNSLARAIWTSFSRAELSEVEAQRLVEMIEARRKPQERPPRRKPDSAARFPSRPPQRSPDRSASLQRRRRLAASGPMPPALAAAFTTAQLAALAVVSVEMIATGRCTLAIDAIAARAGICRSSAKSALAEAARLGLIQIQHRPQMGRKSLTNLVFIISAEWVTWLKHGRRQPQRIGVKNLITTSKQRKRGLARKKISQPFKPDSMEQNAECLWMRRKITLP
jgi:hypothetical protein